MMAGKTQGSGSALSALWWNEQHGVPRQQRRAQPDMAFHGEAGTAFKPQEMVTMRGKWNDSRATFVGSKGGEMGAAHGNLDAGTFVLDALGKRWFHDLGGDNYALPELLQRHARTRRASIAGTTTGCGPRGRTR